MEMELLGFVLEYQNLLDLFNGGSDSWNGPVEKIFVEYRHVSYCIKKSNSLAPLIRYAGIDVVPFQQHPYKSIIPIFGGPQGDVRLRSSVVIRLVSGMLADSYHILRPLLLAAAQAIAVSPEKPVACPSHQFRSEKKQPLSPCSVV